MLTPPPRDFTQGYDPAPDRLLRVISEGSANSAMKGFAGRLDGDETIAVAAYVKARFIDKSLDAGTVSYHTPQAGWPDHRARYGAAFPFVLGEKSIATPPRLLSAAETRGLKLYRESCVACHDGGAALRDGE